MITLTFQFFVEYKGSNLVVIWGRWQQRRIVDYYIPSALLIYRPHNKIVRAKSWSILNY